jgi:hypothetical protein
VPAVARRGNLRSMLSRVRRDSPGHKAEAARPAATARPYQVAAAKILRQKLTC